ncbi:MAG TPA: TonB-dependent receptor [Rhodocyclaceae bacterium]|nr:TonB-dependent receptor [Rhodocyclaceae bacterium]
MKPRQQPFTSSPLRLALLAALSGGAAADDASIQIAPVTVTGSRVEANSFELPYSVDVVDSRQIGEGQLKVNASEALAAVPGITVLNRQNYAQDLQISSRGFGARSAFGVRGMKLIADGIPASNPDGQGQAATFNLDTAERMEILRGPFASVYGNHAGGVIQLFSRDGAGAPRVSAGFTGGSWGTHKLDLGAEGASGPLGYVLDASRFETDGYRQHSAATRDQAFAKLTWQPDADSRLRLTASSLHQGDTQDPLGVTWGTFGRSARAVEDVANTFNTRKSIDHMQGGITYERRFGAHQMELRAYSGTRSVTQYQSIPTGPQLNPRHAGGVVDFDREFHGAGARWTWTRPAAGGELSLTGGVDYDFARDDRRGYQNFVGPTLGVKGALSRNEDDGVQSFDQYAQAQWKAGAWLLGAGLRHSSVRFKVEDHYVVAGNTDDSGRVQYEKTTPSVGASYQLTPSTNLYASAATGFETPTFNELAYSSGGGSFNFNLRPARSRQVEAGVKSLLGEWGRVNAALFQIRTQDELVVLDSTGGRTSYQNAARTLRHGLEIGLEAEIARHWRTRWAFTQLRAIYDQGFTSKGVPVDAGRRLPGIPATTVYGELAWTPIQGITTALEGIYRSRMYVEDTNSVRPAPAYAIANLRLAAEQKSGHWRFSEMLRLENLFDRKYIGSVIVGDANGRYYEPGTGFGWFAGVRAQYAF